MPNLRGLKLLNLIVLVWSIGANAGTGDGAGPGTPRIEYICYQLDYSPTQNARGLAPLEISVGAVWPNYQMKLFILDRTQGTMATELVSKELPDEIGGAVTYKGSSFSLIVYVTSSPILDGSEIYRPSRLVSTDFPSVELKCRRGNWP